MCMCMCPTFYEFFQGVPKKGKRRGKGREINFQNREELKSSIYCVFLVTVGRVYMLSEYGLFLDCVHINIKKKKKVIKPEKKYIKLINHNNCF